MGIVNHSLYIFILGGLYHGLSIKFKLRGYIIISRLDKIATNKDNGSTTTWVMWSKMIDVNVLMLALIFSILPCFKIL
jgi:hypothetical protein